MAGFAAIFEEKLLHFHTTIPQLILVSTVLLPKGERTKFLKRLATAIAIEESEIMVPEIGKLEKNPQIKHLFRMQSGKTIKPNIFGVDDSSG